MNFPGGRCALPLALTTGGKSGPKQVRPDERLPALDSIPTKRLQELLSIEIDESNGEMTQLCEYMRLVLRQCAAELTRRSNV